MKPKTLFIIRGIPGSGKSTHAKSITSNIAEADQYFHKDEKYEFNASKLKEAHKFCRKKVETLMSLEAEKIAVSNTFVRLWEMIPYEKLAKQYGYDVKVIRLETSYASIHNVPYWKICDMRDSFEDYNGEKTVPCQYKTHPYLNVCFSKRFDSYINNSNDISIKNTIYHKNYKIIKYKRKVFYNNSWNQYTEECRGLIYDVKKKKIIQYPFTKIYNYGIEDKSATFSDDESVNYVRKINGFMLAITYDEDTKKLIVSTTGSTDSDYVILGLELLHQKVCRPEALRKYTYLFEVVHKGDPHIIPEDEGIYFIGKRKKEFHSKIELDTNTGLWCSERFLAQKDDSVYLSEVIEDVKFNPYHYAPFKYVKDAVKKVKHEGFVVYSSDFKRVAKIKSPYYLVKKFFARKQNLSNIDKKRIDEEYYPLYNHIQENLNDFSKLSEQERLTYMRNWLEKQYG